MKEHFVKFIDDIKVQIVLCLIAIVIGIVTGALDALFGIGLSTLTTFRQNIGNLYFLPFIPLVALFIAFVFKKYGGKCKKGMSLVFEVENEKEETIPLLLIPFAIVGTWLTHLFGGSAGREGVAMQIGATVSNWFFDKLYIEKASKYLLPIGMAAGFAGLFQTPIASVLFAMEVLVAGEIRYPALLPSMVAAWIAAYTSKFLGLQETAMNLDIYLKMDIKTWMQLIVLGLIFGLVGRAFSFCMHYAQHKAAKVFPNTLHKAIILGIVDAILLIVLYQGRYSGSGASLIEEAMNGGTIYYWDWIFKFGLTILTMCTGMMGGEVVPLFTIGATLGAVIGPLFGMNGLTAAMLGYTAVFASGTNTFFAAIFIGSEIFGFEYMPYFFVVCSIAYICNKNESIYGLQKAIFKRK